jgi:hypothetical protein
MADHPNWTTIRVRKSLKRKIEKYIKDNEEEGEMFKNASVCCSAILGDVVG